MFHTPSSAISAGTLLSSGSLRKCSSISRAPARNSPNACDADGAAAPAKPAADQTE